jgi:hypothetical protein
VHKLLWRTKTNAIVNGFVLPFSSGIRLSIISLNGHGRRDKTHLAHHGPCAACKNVSNVLSGNPLQPLQLITAMPSRQCPRESNYACAERGEVAPLEYQDSPTPAMRESVYALFDPPVYIPRPWCSGQTMIPRPTFLGHLPSWPSTCVQGRQVCLSAPAARLPACLSAFMALRAPRGGWLPWPRGICGWRHRAAGRGTCAGGPVLSALLHAPLTGSRTPGTRRPGLSTHRNSPASWRKAPERAAGSIHA